MNKYREEEQKWPFPPLFRLCWLVLPAFLPIYDFRHFCPARSVDRQTDEPSDEEGTLCLCPRSYFFKVLCEKGKVLVYYVLPRTVHAVSQTDDLCTHAQ